MRKKVLIGVIIAVLLAVVAFEAVMIVNIFEAKQALNALPIM